MIHPRTASNTPDAIAGAAAALLLVVAMLAGGGSRGMGDLAVHLAAVPALALGIVRWRHRDATRMQRWFLWWLLATLGLFALHLLPVPAAVFAGLPQRATVLADLQSAGVDRAWLPITLDAWGALRGLLAMLTFAAMWLLASTLPPPMRGRLLQLGIAVGVLMALLGFAQAAAGGLSQLRLYDYHHAIGAIGTFANRNHFASLLAMLLPCALAFAVSAHRQRRGSAAPWYIAAVILLLAAALSYSRAGFALALASLTATAAVLFWPRKSDRQRAAPALMAALVAGVAVIAVGYYAWDGLMQRLEQDPLADLRWQYLRYGWDTALAYLPLGSGLGSFQWAYAPLEPVSAMTTVYAERAHNEALQTLVELGVPGALLLLGFLALLFMSFISFMFPARKIPMGSEQQEAHHLVSAVTLVAVSVPLLHSLVDYPLRTLCVAVVFALLLSLMQGSTRAGGFGGDRSRLTDV